MKREENSLIYKLKGQIIEFDGDRVTTQDSKGNQDDISVEDMANDIKEYIDKIGESSIEMTVMIKEVK